ncbi:hypothetical protein ARMGADRAFT_1076043 [Armillaria gallica]|uniref:Uncharacterized protein n=1 Tax=Armillaria gallica TaxID=47427 RepID=A0A2H3DQT6_ARMGA|nr:hypothetical protein ARMGADRAFT_1076043 [Armillaria gallica]
MEPLSAKCIFEQETVGIEPYFVAGLVSSIQPQDESDEPLLEQMGMSDVKSPDLTIFSGSSPIGEYNNPDLIKGMFPTLFPFSKGEFEEPHRKVAISFETQANYCLDLNDRCFRYHESFLFIMMNMIQCWQAYLHTHFTVNDVDFGTVMEDIAGVKPETLKDIAKHL